MRDFWILKANLLLHYPLPAGVSSLISLLASAREEDQPKLSVLLCEAVVAVYLSLLIHGLGTHSSNELFRLAAHPLNNRMWAAVFGGGAKVIIKPKRPELPPGKFAAANVAKITGNFFTSVAFSPFVILFCLLLPSCALFLHLSHLLSLAFHSSNKHLLRFFFLIQKKKKNINKLGNLRWVCHVFSCVLFCVSVPSALCTQSRLISRQPDQRSLRRQKGPSRAASAPNPFPFCL